MATSKADKKKADKKNMAKVLPFATRHDLSDATRTKVVASLNQTLAEIFDLQSQVKQAHWNVKGPMFQTLHLMFETQYNELALAVDMIAERIRALGFPAPGTYSEYSKLSSIKETTGVPEATQMIRLLVEGQEAVTRTARKIFPVVDKASDEPTADLLTQRMQVHEKTAWMLRSLLDK